MNLRHEEGRWEIALDQHWFRSGLLRPILAIKQTGFDLWTLVSSITDDVGLSWSIPDLHPISKPTRAALSAKDRSVPVVDVETWR